MVNVCSLQLNYGCYETVSLEFMAIEVLNIPNISVWREGGLSLKGPGPDIYSEVGMNQQSGSEESCIWRRWAEATLSASGGFCILGSKKLLSCLLGSPGSHFSWTETP